MKKSREEEYFYPFRNPVHTSANICDWKREKIKKQFFEFGQIAKRIDYSD